MTSISALMTSASSPSRSEYGEVWHLSIRELNSAALMTIALCPRRMRVRAVAEASIVLPVPVLPVHTMTLRLTSGNFSA